MTTIRIVLKIFAALLFIILLATIATSVSVVYQFKEPTPFSGNDIFNPYRNLDTAYCWKRANFHTHTRVDGLLNECEYTPEQTLKFYDEYGYDIVTFSNHNSLTTHPTDSELQVDLYEHGYNLLKFHKLAFGSNKTNRFDHLLPIFSFQRQWQIDMLAEDSDLVVLNHPYRTTATTQCIMENLLGYDIIELDSGKGTANEYWDWALSAGRYSFALANDDLHYPDRTGAIAVRCNFLCTPSAKYEDIRKTLSEGCYYSMRLPDYGRGDKAVKIERNKSIPYIKNIGVADNTVFISLSQRADSIKVTGQNCTTLALYHAADSVGYTMQSSDPYSRFTAYFAEGEVIYSNAFARYDASVASSPFATDTHERSIPLTILYNLALALLFAAVSTAFYKTMLW